MPDVATSNRQLIAADEQSVTFKVKDYRIKGPDRYTMMTLATHEFIAAPIASRWNALTRIVGLPSKAANVQPGTNVIWCRYRGLSCSRTF